MLADFEIKVRHSNESRWVTRDTDRLPQSSSSSSSSSSSQEQQQQQYTQQYEQHFLAEEEAILVELMADEEPVLELQSVLGSKDSLSPRQQARCVWARPCAHADHPEPTDVETFRISIRCPCMALGEPDTCTWNRAKRKHAATGASGLQHHVVAKAGEARSRRLACTL